MFSVVSTRRRYEKLGKQLVYEKYDLNSNFKDELILQSLFALLIKALGKLQWVQESQHMFFHFALITKSFCDVIIIKQCSVRGRRCTPSQSIYP